MNYSGSNSSTVTKVVDVTSSTSNPNITVIISLGVSFTILTIILAYWVHYGFKRKFRRKIITRDTQKSNDGVDCRGHFGAAISDAATPAPAISAPDQILLVEECDALIFTMLINRRNNELLDEYKKYGSVDSEKFRQLVTSVEARNAEVNNLAVFLWSQSKDEEQKLYLRNFYLPYRKLCRIPWIPCYFSQSFTPFHCNLILDFYNVPIYLCAAPTLSEIAEFWDFILSQKIGVVVMTTNGENDRNLDTYTPMVENATEIYGLTKVKNTHTVKHNIFNTYSINVLEPTNIQICFIHCHNITPRNQYPQELSTLLTSISNNFDRTTNDSHSRNGILLHDATGLEESVVLAAAHIGLQTLRNDGQISILALCQYIRRYRFGALTFSSKLRDLMAILFHLLATNYLIDIDKSESNVFGLMCIVYYGFLRLLSSKNAFGAMLAVSLQELQRFALN